MTHYRVRLTGKKKDGSPYYNWFTRANSTVPRPTLECRFFDFVSANNAANRARTQDSKGFLFVEVEEIAAA